MLVIESERASALELKQLIDECDIEKELEDFSINVNFN